MKKKLTLEEIKLEEMLSKIERDLTEKKRAPNFRKKYKQHSGIKNSQWLPSVVYKQLYRDIYNTRTSLFRI